MSEQRTPEECSRCKHQHRTCESSKDEMLYHCIPLMRADVERLRAIVERCLPVIEVVDSMNDEGGEFTQEDEELLADIREVLK